jgi:hypothetical protein
MNYFELYYAYLAWCEKDNWVNYRDPNHDFMEWNHTLPQCIFKGHGPGQWLTKEQHAIASALQTLIFRKNCLCGWHMKWLPEKIRSKIAVYYRKASAEKGKKGEKKRKEEKTGLYAPGVQSLGGLAAKEKKKGIHDPASRTEYAILGGRRVAELGVGIHGDPEARRRGARKASISTNSQVWESTVDGFRSTSSAVAKHNKARGWDPAARIRIS